eukprot:gene10473-8436_t
MGKQNLGNWMRERQDVNSREFAPEVLSRYGYVRRRAALSQLATVETVTRRSHATFELGSDAPHAHTRHAGPRCASSFLERPFTMIWVKEPSTDQSGTVRIVPESLQVHTFSETPRFVRDGGHHPDQPNFLNPRDTQGVEVGAKHADVHTNTHATYEDRLYSTKAVLAMADEVEKSLHCRAPFKSTRPRSATAKSYLSRDTRYTHLHEPYAEPIGPGSYWVEGGRPDLGLLAPDSPMRGASPSKDPWRANAGFVSTDRKPLWKPADGAHVAYYGGASDMEFKIGEVRKKASRAMKREARLDPSMPNVGYQDLGTGPPVLARSPNHLDYATWLHGVTNRLAEFGRPSARSRVEDYRYATRHREISKEIPDKDYETPTDRNSRLTDIAANASTKAVNVVPFHSKETRFFNLPTSRHNDARLARSYRSDEDPGNLGPGSYGPLISQGAAKRSTYRLFSSPPASPSSRGSTQSPSVAQAARLSMPSGYERGKRMGSSSNFTGALRSQAYGPFTHKTDSALTRTF